MRTDLPELLVHMVVGRDGASRSLADEIDATRQDFSRLTVERAYTRRDAVELVRRPCHLLIIAGHGYKGVSAEDWCFSGTESPILRATDLPPQIDSSFLVLGTCYVHPPFWQAKLRPGVSLAHGSQTSWPSAVFRPQYQHVRTFVLDVAAGHKDDDGHDDWTPRGLRATWDRATSATRTFMGPDRFWMLPTEPS